jgi:ATP-dependent DNA helicase RecG
MALPINIEDLLNKRKIESNRIEFKKGWNPDRIYRTICAFANDFDNIGGGYILVGVEEENGIAKRPVTGIPDAELDKIQKAMVGFNNKLNPYYMPRIDVEEVDGKNVLAIWVPAGTNRPYDVKESVVAKQSVSKWYIRSGTSSIEAKGEVLDELREMASRVPFDDRGNPDIKLSDLDPLLVQDYLKRVNSKLLKDFRAKSFEEILDQMDLFVGPTERRMIKNVAAMMFCENPEKFFPTTQVDIVIFPEGLEKNPNNMIEVPKIVGPVPYMIKATLDYLRTVVIKERIIKPKDRAESIRFFNYPYQAFEEAVVNALYHRDYQEREPVEITVEPNMVSILSYAGPDRSISMAAIKEAKKLKARRYRNRRLGDFLKELELSEGRATGIPTIQDELHKNGSPDASIETDDDRSYFLIEIPCREGFEGLDDTNDPINDTRNDNENDTEKRLITNRQKLILSLIKGEATISNRAIAERLSVSIITIKRDINKLTELGFIRHIGPAKGGRWEIITKE